MERSLRLLNEHGDLTITWLPEQDDEIEKIIAARMAAGVTFYLLPKKATSKPTKKLKDSAKAREYRALLVKDEDLTKFVLDGKGKVESVPVPAKIEGKRATSAKEVASGHSVGVQPRRGG